MDHEHFEKGNIGAMRFDEGDVSLRSFGLDNDRLEFGKCAGVA